MAKVVIIDDTPYHRLELAAALGELGHEFVEASDGKEGLAAIDEVSPDIVCCDLRMPNLDGFGVLEALQSRKSAPPIIIVSSDAERETRARCRRLGASGFVEKPVTTDRLRAALDEVMD